MKMDKQYLSNVMTSGEAAMHAINKNKFGKLFFHLGPPRDISIFEKVKDNKISKTDILSREARPTQTKLTLVESGGLWRGHSN